MISETTPLNEWPLEKLQKLRRVIAIADSKINHDVFMFIGELIVVVDSAIKDAKF